MLREFVQGHRPEILARARLRVAARNDAASRFPMNSEGLPIFLEQLCAALLRAEQSEVADHSELDSTARVHGQQLFERGITAAQLVHDYGDLCQVITGLAVEQRTGISAEEFQTLNLCLDDAIAGAITAYGEHRDRRLAADGAERLGMLAHEMRNVVNTAMLAFASIKKGVVPAGGSTGVLLEHNLLAMETLIDRSFADVRLETGVQNAERVALWELFEEVAIGGALAAASRQINFVVLPVDHTATVTADRQLLAAALANLLQNAFKFTKPGTRVELRARTTPTHVSIEVEDECGGLPEGQVSDLLVPFSQRSGDRSGLGLGLALCVKAMKTMDGELRIRDLPGQGCIFSLELPLQTPGPTSIFGPGSSAAPGSSGGGTITRLAPRGV